MGSRINISYTVVDILAATAARWILRREETPDETPKCQLVDFLGYKIDLADRFIHGKPQNKEDHSNDDAQYSITERQSGPASKRYLMTKCCPLQQISIGYSG